MANSKKKYNLGLGGSARRGVTGEDVRINCTQAFNSHYEIKGTSMIPDQDEPRRDYETL